MITSGGEIWRPAADERAGEDAVVARLQRDAVGQARVVGEQRRVDLHRGDGAVAAADLAHELVLEQRRERGRDLGLELEPAGDEALALDDVEVRVGRGGGARVAGVGVAVAPDARGRAVPERLLDRASRR